MTETLTDRTIYRKGEAPICIKCGKPVDFWKWESGDKMIEGVFSDGKQLRVPGVPMGVLRCHDEEWYEPVPAEIARE